MSAPANTPSTETRVYSIIFRIRWCPFTKMCRDSWELFPFHLICERCQSPFTYRTPLWSQTHRRVKANMGNRAEKSVASKRREWRGSHLTPQRGGDPLYPLCEKIPCVSIA